MEVSTFNVKDYEPKSTDSYFFDNNIWMYIFCPLGNYNKKRQRYYSNFLQKIKRSDSCIFISSLILSEFSNRYLRIDFEMWKKENNSFEKEFKKDYVGSERYIQTVDEIKRHTKQIMSFCEKTSDSFNAINLENVHRHLEKIDFNDSYYIELLSLNKWKLVTDDRDFLNYKNHSLDVITFVD